MSEDEPKFVSDPELDGLGANSSVAICEEATFRDLVFTVDAGFCGAKLTFEATGDIPLKGNIGPLELPIGAQVV